MSCTIKFNVTRKLREGEREKNREREKERERENGQNEESGHLHLAVLIFSCSYQITNKRRFQRRKKGKNTFFRVLAITHRKIKIRKIINIFNFRDKT
jgi:hypothetical protein